MKINKSIKLANLKMLEFVAIKLGDLCSELVFLGGCTTALFITDAATPDVRYTLDVDCIVDVISISQYYQLGEKLTACGFKRSMSDDVICRWHYDNVILDVMPSDEAVLGFGNRWYKTAIHHAVDYQLASRYKIKLVTAPYFLATKLEAFKGRGNSDYLASHDFEDIISVIDGRIEIVNEIADADKPLKKYLTKSFSELNNNRYFHDALPGHLTLYGNLADRRIEVIQDRIKQIGQLTEK